MSNTSTPSDGGTPEEPLVFQALEDRLAALESSDAEDNQGAPVRPAQSGNVAGADRPRPNPLPTMDDSGGDKDYVSILQFFLAASQGKGTTLTYRDAIPVNDSTSPSPLWTQSLVLTMPPDAPLVFPAEGQPPKPFGRKKDAKKYCAELCVAHLVSRSLLVPDPSDPSSLTVPSTVVLKRKGVVVGAGGAGVDPEDDTLPATQRVMEMCRRLDLLPPTYRLTAAGPTGSGVWDGVPDFGRDSMEVPEGLGIVKGVFGKAKAKEMMAEEVLRWLLEKDEQLERELDELEEEDDDD